MKTISFVVPCYNSSQYMDKCINSILVAGRDIEIIIVNDGSTKDNTLEIAKRWESEFPTICKCIDKENGGHGSAVNAGLAVASGRYFKVVDSDDWLDPIALLDIMNFVREEAQKDDAIDMVICNYVYEKVYEGERRVVHYKNALPEGKPFTWEDVSRFLPGQFILMHSVIYRTQLLKDINLTLPDNTFYVDNIFVYTPLPHVKSIYYRDIDLYRYFIGREGQSVNEQVMISRIDQQLKITKIMIDSVNLDSKDIPKALSRYMESYLSVMTSICAIFLRMGNTEEDIRKYVELWDYLKNKDSKLYKKVKRNSVSMIANLPTAAGRKFSLSMYRILQKLYLFN